MSTEQVPRGKPAPDIYLAVAARLGCAPADCAAVEDSSNGLRSAAAAGLHVIAVPHPQYPPDPDALAAASLVLPTLAGLHYRRRSPRLPEALPAASHSEDVNPPRRLSIPGCIGCGAMRQYESCAGPCHERRLRAVSGADYDALTAAAAACRARTERLRAVVGELALREPGPGEWRAAYEALQQSARSVLRRFRPAAVGRHDEALSPAPTVTVWRCEDCGGVDAPQPCIDVCIWGPA